MIPKHLLPICYYSLPISVLAITDCLLCCYGFRFRSTRICFSFQPDVLSFHPDVFSFHTDFFLLHGFIWTRCQKEWWIRTHLVTERILVPSTRLAAGRVAAVWDGWGISRMQYWFDKWSDAGQPAGLGGSGGTTGSPPRSSPVPGHGRHHAVAPPEPERD